MNTIYRTKQVKAFLTGMTIILTVGLSAQNNALRLHLQDCIEMATDSTLTAFRAKNLFMSSYWEYRTYKAQRLPLAILQLTPVEYHSNFIKRYDFNENVEVYRQQQSLSASGALSISQNIDLTGGTLILDTGLDFMRYFGDNIYNQYSSVPVRLGYSQSLFGYNSFKWQKKIEPLKYEKAKQQLLYSKEDIAETTVNYFFNLAMAQTEYTMAVENVASADSLYLAGKERRRISSISEADLLTLNLDLINAETSYENADIQLERATSAFRSFLNLDNRHEINLELPMLPRYFEISTEEAILHVKANNPLILENRQKVLELEQEVDRTKKTSGFDASLSASMGFNQAADNLKEAYMNPLRQDVFRVSVSVPILDWGIRKGRVNMAKNNLNVGRLSVEQNEQDLEQEIKTLVLEFNKQQNLVRKASEALEMSISSYNINKHRFIIGKTDVNTVTLSSNRRKEAQRNYLNALANYWRCYYGIRKLTLYDYEKKQSLSFLFDSLWK